MTPITKNVDVIDEQGNKYEATYPKRAKGLVKKGRARFVNDKTICLACPPKNILEDITMNNDSNQNKDMQEQAKVAVEAFNTLKEEYSKQNPTEKLTMNYVLEQIEKISSQTEYLNNTIQGLSKMPNTENPGDVGAQAKAQALGDVVRCRETTNQQLLTLYEKMYDDLKPKNPSTKEKALEITNKMFSDNSWCDSEKEMLTNILDTIRRLED